MYYINKHLIFYLPSYLARNLNNVFRLFYTLFPLFLCFSFHFFAIFTYFSYFSLPPSSPQSPFPSGRPAGPSGYTHTPFHYWLCSNFYSFPPFSPPLSPSDPTPLSCYYSLFSHFPGFSSLFPGSYGTLLDFLAYLFITLFLPIPHSFFLPFSSIFPPKLYKNYTFFPHFPPFSPFFPPFFYH